MSRTTNYEHRAQLLERAVDYVIENGLGDLSLRPLATALGVTPTTLVHHFGTKDELVGRVLNEVRQRIIDVVAPAADSAGTPAETMLAAWQWTSAPEHERLFRLFFEVYGRALQQPERFAPFLERVVRDWLEVLEQRFVDAGVERRAARASATLGLAVSRGLLLDLLTTHERERVTAAVELFAFSGVRPKAAPGARG